jgi:DNA-binding response OmpR family regulator
MIAKESILERASAGVIVYIDDSQHCLDLISHLLHSQTDYRLLTSTRGKPGLALAAKIEPTLILLDLHLPDMSGLDIITRLRADQRTATTPVIVLSADAHQEQANRCLEAGANEVLVKPCDMNELLALLIRYMNDATATSVIQV